MPIDAPASYQADFDSVSACAHIAEWFPLSSVRFYVVPGAQFECRGAGVAVGCTNQETRSVYLAKGNPGFTQWYLEPWAVEHELLHLLSGRTDHPPVFAACHLLASQN